MWHTSPLPGLPTMKHQSVKKKKGPVCDEDLGVNFQPGAWGFSGGTPITCNGNPAASFHAYCMETAPFHGYTILVLKLRPSFLEQSRFSERPNYSVLAWGLCVCASVYERERGRERMPFS